MSRTADVSIRYLVSVAGAGIKPLIDSTRLLSDSTVKAQTTVEMSTKAIAAQHKELERIAVGADTAIAKSAVSASTTVNKALDSQIAKMREAGASYAGIIKQQKAMGVSAAELAAAVKRSSEVQLEAMRVVNAKAVESARVRKDAAHAGGGAGLSESFRLGSHGRIRDNASTVIGAAGLAGFASYEGISRAVENTINRQKTSATLQVAGLSSPTAQALAAGTSALGIPSATLATAIKTLATKSTGALRPGATETKAQPFLDLGISKGTLQKDAGDTSKLLGAVADKIQQGIHGSKQYAAAAALLGKGFAALNPLLADGSKGLERNTELAQKYGLITRGSASKGLKELHDKQIELKFANMGLQTSIATNLTPVLLKVLPVFASITHTLGQQLKPALNDISKVAKPVIEFFKKGGDNATIAKGAIFALVAGLVVFKTTVVAVTAVTKAWEVVQAVLDAELTANPIGLVVAALAALAVGLIYAYNHSKTFRDVVDGVFKFLKDTVTTVVAFVSRHWQLIVAAIIGPIGLVAYAIKKFGPDVLHWIETAFSNVVSFLGSLPDKFAKIGGSIADGFVGAFKSIGGTIGDIFRGALDAVIGVIDSGIQQINKLLGPRDLGPLGSTPDMRLPMIPKLAGGGYVPGDPTRDGTLAMLAGNEFVMTGSGQQMMDAYAPGLLDHIAAAQLPHFAAGGYAGLHKGNKASGRVVTSSYFGGHDDPSAFNHSTASGKIANDSLWGFAELSNPPGSHNFSALGKLPMGTIIPVSYGGKTVRIPKVDVGAGGAGINGHVRAIDLTYAVHKALGTPGIADVMIGSGGAGHISLNTPKAAAVPTLSNAVASLTSRGAFGAGYTQGLGGSSLFDRELTAPSGALATLLGDIAITKNAANATGAAGPLARGRAAAATVGGAGYMTPWYPGHLGRQGRTDRGVDYEDRSANGAYRAIGAGRVTMAGPGFPGVAYTLSGGSFAGREVFHGHTSSAAQGLRAGMMVRAGQMMGRVGGAPFASSTHAEVGFLKNGQVPAITGAGHFAQSGADMNRLLHAVDPAVRIKGAGMRAGGFLRTPMRAFRSGGHVGAHHHGGGGGGLDPFTAYIRRTSASGQTKSLLKPGDSTDVSGLFTALAREVETSVYSTAKDLSSLVAKLKHQSRKGLTVIQGRRLDTAINLIEAEIGNRLGLAVKALDEQETNLKGRQSFLTNILTRSGAQGGPDAASSKGQTLLAKYQDTMASFYLGEYGTLKKLLADAQKHGDKATIKDLTDRLSASWVNFDDAYTQGIVARRAALDAAAADAAKATAAVTQGLTDKTSLDQAGLANLDLSQKLAGTDANGGQAKSDFITARIIPDLQAELANLKENAAGDAARGDQAAFHADSIAAANKANEILQAQLDAQDAIKANTATTASKALGGQLAFGFAGQFLTDQLVNAGLGV